jgi:GT2 family glycosyltransferase/SAM-dependent methyltransferase
MNGIMISLIVPTRGRVIQMQRFLDSVLATARRPQGLEIVMVVDSDDSESQKFKYDGLKLITVVVPVGASMGALNMAGYHASKGQYLMLMNDDVIVRTAGWDEKVLAVFSSFPDDIVLVHTEDGIFHEKLCTFPFVSRTFCEMAGGICPEGYFRYRIDDHLYNVFNLLAVLQHKRIAYLPDVVFEHLNYVVNQEGAAEYVPNPVIHANDTTLFDRLLGERKELALKLAGWIDAHRQRQTEDTRRKVLAPIVDSVSLRRPEYTRTFVDCRPKIDDTRVTVGVVSANLHGDHARRCIDLLKMHTSNFELIVIDNNRSGDFNHSREMNRLLGMCRTDYLVLMDDDVWVTVGWLEGLLGAMGSDVGVVTPLHLDREGSLSYAGVVMRPDSSGHHSHIYEAPDSPVPIQTLCSAVMLIDMTKVGDIRVDESYSKYFLDIDYGLRIWEAGYKVMLAPGSICTHLGGATLAHQSSKSNDLFEVQRQHWVGEWIDTGRFVHLCQTRWMGVDAIKSVLLLTARISSLFDRGPAETIDEFIERALPVMRAIQSIPTLLHHTQEKIVKAVAGSFVSVYDPQFGHLMVLYGMCGAPTKINGNLSGFDIYVCGDKFYSVGADEHTPTRDQLAALAVPGAMETVSLSTARARTDGRLAPDRKAFVLPDVKPKSQPVASIRNLSGVMGGKLVLEGYLGYNIVFYDSYYGVRQADGAFEISRMRNAEYMDSVSGESIEAVKAAIRTNWPSHIPYHLGRISKAVIRRSIRRLTASKPRNMESTSPVPTQKHLNESRVTNEAPSSQRSAQASRPTIVIENYGGYAIVRYEHKYFCVSALEVTRSKDFNYQRFCQNGYSKQALGHSLTEAYSLIEGFRTEALRTNERILVMGTLSPQRIEVMLGKLNLNMRDALVLVGDKDLAEWTGWNAVCCGTPSLQEWARAGKPVLQSLSDARFTRVIVPWSFPESWFGNAIEVAAARVCERVEIVMGTGQSRTYFGENLHRLIYNKAYLSSMFQVLPSPEGKEVLEVGCSDGLVCDLFSAMGATHVEGVDVMQTAGCSFPGPNVTYRTMAAEKLDFPDNSFDMVFSIATLEHVQDPSRVMKEILRVTKPGGHVYVQAGPLYHSPYGHHMFAYFNDQPWIHLRKSISEIIAFTRTNGIDVRIEGDLGLTAEQYIKGMLTPEHINGLLFDEYGLNTLIESPDLQVLKYTPSVEGEDMLTDEIFAELSHYNKSDLIAHGFEFAFLRIR